MSVKTIFFNILGYNTKVNFVSTLTLSRMKNNNANNNGPKQFSTHFETQEIHSFYYQIEKSNDQFVLLSSNGILCILENGVTYI